MEYIKICKNPECNKEFLSRYSFQVYCSAECKYKVDSDRIKARYQDSDDRIGTCKICGEQFRKSKSLRAFCSEECKRADNKAKNQTFECKCQSCHKVFQSVIEDKKFCSATCRKNGVKRKVMSIAEIALAARKEGITYGQYVAKYEV